MTIPFFLRSSCLLALLASVGGCHRPAAETPICPPVVTVSHPVSLPVTDYLDLSGTVAASKTVNLVARVSGYLQSVNFADGDQVKTGQLLFVIEPDQYQEQVNNDQASLLQAQSEYDRQQELIKENATSKANLEKQKSLRDEAQAQLNLSEINLGYTKITAPFTGRIGARQVDPGNLVGAGSPTLLATLQQLAPIYVNFSLNERDALQIHERMRQAGLTAKSGVGKIPVFVGLQHEAGYPHRGVLDFADNGISTTTGTIAVRAIFDNKDGAMFPGLFARVRVPLGEPKPMPVVPAGAVSSDQEGEYVLVVDGNNVVARRSIVKGPMTKDGYAISSGITTADNVVVNGLLNAVPGGKVTPQAASAGTNNPDSLTP